MVDRSKDDHRLTWAQRAKVRVHMLRDLFLNLSKNLISLTGRGRMASPSLACESNFMASTSNGNDNNDAKSKPRSRWRNIFFFFFLCVFLPFPISQPAATRHVPSSTCVAFLNPPALLWNPRQTFYFLINSFLRPISSWLLIFWDILIFLFHKQFSSSLSCERFELSRGVSCCVDPRLTEDFLLFCNYLLYSSTTIVGFI